MAAYHNSDWAECYDLWVRHLFGNSPAEDIPVFVNQLKSIAETKSPGSPISIIDIGTGSGRVLIDLQTAMQEIPGRKFDIWGTEPSGAMLERAKRFWNAAIEEKKRKQGWMDDKIQVHWCQCSATNFASQMGEQIGQGIDLIIFAAGGFSHIIEDSDIQTFLGQVSKVLSINGKVIISFLREYILDTDENAFTTLGTNDNEPDTQLQEILSKPQRIPSEDFEGRVHVKHPSNPTWRPSTGTWIGGILTETFRLDVENARDGTLIRSHELSWDAKILDGLIMLEYVHDKGMHLAQEIEGKVQIWWILHRK